MGARRNRVRRLAAAAFGLAASAGLAALTYIYWRREKRHRHCRDLLERWCRQGPAKEPIVDCQVPETHGMDGDDVSFDVVEVPIGLMFECERLRECLREKLAAEDDECLVEALQCIWDAEDAPEPTNADSSNGGPTEAATALLELNLPWIDLAALAQLTYWYDRRPQGEELAAAAVDAAEAGKEAQKARLTDAKFGRWTKKVSRQKVVYGTVALRYRTRGHLGQQVFRRPAGIDVTRLQTLRRAAALCGHEPLLGLVEDTMEQLQPKNVAKIPWEEVQRHTKKEDLWLLIDGKVYDVTPFLDLHPGGGQLIADASGKDATSLFEMTHGEGLRYSLRLLNQFFIGDCIDASKAEPAEPAKSSPEFLETLRSITGALHTFDEARATGDVK